MTIDMTIRSLIHADTLILQVSSGSDDILLFVSGPIGGIPADDLLDSAYFEIKVYP